MTVDRLYVEALLYGRDWPDLADLVARPPWMRDAACLEHPEVSFYVDLGGATEPAVLPARPAPHTELLVVDDRVGEAATADGLGRRHLRQQRAA